MSLFSMLRFDLFWEKIDKKCANLEEPDSYFSSVQHFEQWGVTKKYCARLTLIQS